MSAHLIAILSTVRRSAGSIVAARDENRGSFPTSTRSSLRVRGGPGSWLRSPSLPSGMTGWSMVLYAEMTSKFCVRSVASTMPMIVERICLRCSVLIVALMSDCALASSRKPVAR